jgi:serine/threonine-protein kinase
VLDRLAAIRVVGSPALGAPLATGTFDGGTWVVESVPAGTTLAERIRDGGPLAVQRVVRLLRDAARALSALHRHGLVHGGIDPSGIEETGSGFILHGLARRLDGSVNGDLHAIGEVAWLALVGREPAAGDRSPRRVRRKLPVDLDRLVAALLDPDPAGRPASAEAVLEALDRFPVEEETSLGTLIDGAGRGARLPGERRTAVILGVIGVLVILGWLVLRSR